MVCRGERFVLNSTCRSAMDAESSSGNFTTDLTLVQREWGSGDVTYWRSTCYMLLALHRYNQKRKSQEL